MSNPTVSKKKRPIAGQKTGSRANSPPRRPESIVARKRAEEETTHKQPEKLAAAKAKAEEEARKELAREVEEAKEAKVEMPRELKIIFDEYDTNGNGVLSPDELARLLRDLDFDTDDIIISDILRRIDANSDGSIDLLEMAEWWHECDELMDLLVEALDSNDPGALEKAIRHGQRQVFPFPRTSRFRLVPP